MELNASFYRWPRDASFVGWRRRLPTGFVLSVKAPRGLTHGRRLYGPETWIERMSRSWHQLGDRRGAVLFQLPPDLERDDDRLAYLLARLPWWMDRVVELRHPSWHCEPVFELLAILTSRRRQRRSLRWWAGNRCLAYAGLVAQALGVDQDAD